MKKLLAMLVMAVMLFALPCANAETTGETDMLTITEMIDAKTVEEYDNIVLGEMVQVDEFFTLMVTGVYCLESEQKDMMQVHCRVTAQATTPDLSASDYDFMLVTVQDGKYVYQRPDEVYGIIGTDRRAQAFAWPIALSCADEMELVFVYNVPKTETQLGILYTNIWGNHEEGYTSGGNMKLYTKKRTVMDFRFINSSGKTISELYVRPVNHESWDENLLLYYEEPSLEDGIWIVVEFASGKWETAVGKEWELKVVFEDGSDAVFSTLALDDILCLELVVSTEKEGGYSLTVRR